IWGHWSSDQFPDCPQKTQSGMTSHDSSGLSQANSPFGKRSSTTSPSCSTILGFVSKGILCLQGGCKLAVEVFLAARPPLLQVGKARSLVSLEAAAEAVMRLGRGTVSPGQVGEVAVARGVTRRECRALRVGPFARRS